jgi:hypothetical protein
MERRLALYGGVMPVVSGGLLVGGVESQGVMSFSDRDTEVIVWLLICWTCSSVPGKLMAL